MPTRSRANVLAADPLAELDDHVPSPARGRSFAQLPGSTITAVPASATASSSQQEDEGVGPEEETTRNDHQLGEAVRAFLAQGPFEAVARSAEVLIAKARSIGRTLYKMGSVSADEVGRGHLVGAFEAAGSTLEEELDDGANGGSQGLGFLMVFVALAVFWISELVLARLWDQRAQGTPQGQESGQLEDGVPKADESRLFLHGLSFARYLMAWHVVLDHFAYGGDTGQKQTSMVGEPWAVFARWGVVAAPWFYMVSGFTNSYSKLVCPHEERGQEEDFIKAMLKRAFTWYPFYLIALFWCAIRLATTEAEDWAHFLAHGTTIHGLVWGDNETFPFLAGDVWLSRFVPYLLTWTTMHSAMADASSEQSKDSFIWTVFYMSFWITIPSAVLEWIWFSHLPLFALVQLWPSFVFGQALAFWFVKRCMEEKTSPVGPGGVLVKVWVRRRVTDIPVVVRFGASFSMLIFGIMFFTFSPYDPVPLFQKPVLPCVQKGFQLPLQGLMVVGFAAEVDPIAKLFARRPFRFAEKLTLMTFIFQVPVYNTIKDSTGWSGITWTFAGSLIAFTVVAHVLLERPYRQWRGDRERGDSWQDNITPAMK